MHRAPNFPRNAPGSADDLVVLLRPKFNVPAKTYEDIPALFRPQTAPFKRSRPVIYNIGTPSSTSREPAQSFLSEKIPKTAAWAFKKSNPRIYDRLYAEAKAISSRKSNLAKVFQESRQQCEEDEISKAKLKIQDSARLCSDSRSHEMREAELLQKRLKWTKKRIEVQRKREEDEMRECTFIPDIRKKLPCLKH
jgi:hypothetical protein